MRNLVVFSVCLVFVFQCFQVEGFGGARFGGARRSWFRRGIIRKPAPKPTPKATLPPVIFAIPDARNPSGLPLCSGQVDVNKILQQGASGDSKRRVKRQTSWPYDCSYASIITYEKSYQFMTAIYSCCDACRSPSYTQCIASSPAQYWQCPSRGLHCIVDCVAKHDPNRQLLIKPGGGFPGILGGNKETSSVFPPKKKELQCSQTVTVNGKKCIKQLCVSLLGPNNR